MSGLAVDDKPALTPHRRPRRWLWLVLAAAMVVVLAVAAGAVWFTQFRTPVADDVPDTRPPVTTRIGVFRGTDVQEVQAFEAWLGRDVDYVVDFSARSTWTEIAQPQYMIDAWKDTGYRPVYSVAMLPENPADTMERGARGEYDKHYRELARRLVAGNQADAIIRLGWEFNLEESRWSTDNPQAFIQYWRHVVAAMREQPGQKFEFDWNPNNGKAKYDAPAYYPGNDVVDYIGIDAYDTGWGFHTYPYPADCDQGCRSARQENAWHRSIYGGVRGLAFWSKFAREKGKPMSLPEWGIWEREDKHGGGNDPDYLRRMQAFIADPKNRVAYQAYFEVDGHDGPHRLMTTYPEAGKVFKELFAEDQ
jgi:hypothetical protein